jgi:hypothetical protein
MKSMLLGHDAAGRPMRLTAKQRASTHMHVIGGSGTGKSKFLEWMIGRDIREGNGLCLIDWHGTLYNDVVRHCGFQNVGLPGDFRSVVLLNPSQPDFITGFNPFVAGAGDVSVQVSRRVDATIRPWGATNTDQTPTFGRICRLLYTFMIENRQTLPNAATLLHFKNSRLRERAAESLTDSFSRAEWEELQAITRRQDWKEEVLSTKNRLMRFVGSKSVRRFMGLEQNNVDLMRVMEEGKILLINLGSSDYLDREAARVFASLVLNEFFETAMRRATSTPQGRKPKTFALYLDEFQEYLTDDVAAMLDQVRKGGLHMVLAHQHLGHFADNDRLKESVFTNARIRAVFGGLSTPSASELAEEMFLPDLNSRQIKKAYYHTIHLYEEQTRTIRGSSRSVATSHSCGFAVGMSGPVEGWFADPNSLNASASEFESASDSESESESEVEVPVFVPIPVQELASETEWSREEKVSRVAEMLKYQQQRHCFIKLDTEKTQPLKVPFVREFRLPESYLAEYQRKLYDRQGAIRAAEADRLISESERAFLMNVARPAESLTLEATPVEVPTASRDDFFE